MLSFKLSSKKFLTFLMTLSFISLTACQSLPQSSNQNTSQGYESPIPVHVSGFTGVRF